MEFKSILHDHALTHCENNNGEAVCDNCGNPLKDDETSCWWCFNSEFIENRCSYCDQRLSIPNSFNICNLCWHRSPIFHQSCVDIKEEIRITYRPHCSLLLEPGMGWEYCDFCSNSFNHPYKYLCGDCDLQICYECASKLINYHEGQDHIDHFSHRHPLTMLKLDDMTCNICCKLIDDGSAYGCAPCMFYLHNSCRDEFLPEIRYNFHPRHSLKFIKFRDGYYQCHVCRLDVQGLGYRCGTCEFNLHPICTTLKSKIRYKGHPHLLILVENLSHISHCEACGFVIDMGVFYVRCVECFLDFHVQCDPDHPLPSTVLHEEHEHPLILSTDTDDSLNCNVCGQERNPEHPFYHCAECYFSAHVRCAITEVEYDEDRKLKHFSHDHILMLRDLQENEDIRCEGCEKSVLGSAYCCDRCQFYLHKSCVEMPTQIYDHESPQIGHFNHRNHLVILEVDTVSRKLGQCYGCAQCEFYIHNSCCAFLREINHPFHPGHYLELFDFEENEYCCKACCFGIKGLGYQCYKCSFYLHLECSSLKPNIVYKGHQHLLTLVENMFTKGQCEACGFTILNAFFMRCVECDINFHVQCGTNALPPAISHKQSGHCLTLIAELPVGNHSDQLFCFVCNREMIQKYPAYYCADVDYYAHVRCVITEVQFDESERLKHFSHQHPLFPFENKRNDNIRCSACGKKIQADPGYECKYHQCRFYLHRSCANLPRVIQHPFHKHPLTLPNPYSGEHLQCKACLKNYSGFSYQCPDCEFNLDLDCYSLFPSLKLQLVHQHTLILFKKLYGTPECDHCKSNLSNKLTPLDAFYFRCVVCNFSRHLLCCRLPTTIEHKSHHHLLTLRDNFIDIFDGFDDEDYCCDFCETRRAAREPVYHCKECNFVVDIECVFYEVMQFLEGKHKCVYESGRVISREIFKNHKGITYKSILESLTEDENSFMASFTESKDVDLSSIFKDLKGISDLAYERISIELLDIGDFNPMASIVEQLKSMKDELVDVRGYKICQKLAPVLKNLLDKYGDIGTNCLLQKLVKTIPLAALCLIILKMRETRVIEITDGSIIDWWFNLKLIETAGIRTDFALDHLKRIVYVHFLIDPTNPNKRSPLYRIHERIAENCERIKKLRKEIEDMKKVAQDTVSAYGYEGLSEEKTLNETLRLSWNDAASELIDNTIEFW